MMRGTPHWKIELQAGTIPIEEWVTLRYESGRRYVFVDRLEAEHAFVTLRKHQPHARLRIAPM